MSANFCSPCFLLKTFHQFSGRNGKLLSRSSSSYWSARSSLQSGTRDPKPYSSRIIGFGHATKMMRRCLPCFDNRSSDDSEPDLDPVLLVSGIAGSILNAKTKKCGFDIETRVWVRILFSDLEFRKYAWSVYNPKTGTQLFCSQHIRAHSCAHMCQCCVFCLIKLRTFKYFFCGIVFGC